MSVLNVRSILAFSLAVVCHTELLANTEVPDFYNEPGLSDSRQSSIGSVNDLVDPFSGQLSVMHTDLSIPGNGGFDINIVRSYSTHRAQSPFRGKSVVGHGWDLHMGRIHFDGPLNTGICHQLKASPYSTGNPVLELPNGSKKLFLKPEYNYTSTFSDGSVQTRSVDFITQDMWIADCHETTNDDVVGGITVTSPNGIVYRFDLPNRPELGGSVAYLVTEIKDARGNTATIEYDDQYIVHGSASRVIKKISTSDGRVVNFDYEQLSTPFLGHPSVPLLTAIKFGAKEIRYHYAETGPAFNITPFVFLKRVSKTDGDDWLFNYYPAQANIYTTPESFIAGARSTLLMDITSEFGAITRYDYRFIPSGVGNGVNPAVVERSINTDIALNDGDAQGTWRYEYQLGPVDGMDYDKTTVITPTKKEIYRHFGIYAADRSAEIIDVNEITQANPGISDRDLQNLVDPSKKLWKIGSLMEKTIAEKGEAGAIRQIETYQWKSHIISSADDTRSGRGLLVSRDTRGPLLATKTVWRDPIDVNLSIQKGTLYTTNYDDYDVLGNPLQITTTRTDKFIQPPVDDAPFDYAVPIKKVQKLTYFTAVNQWLMGLPSSEEIYDIGLLNQLSQVSSVFRNYLANGLVKEGANNGVVTRFSYDDQGNLLSLTDANSHTTHYADYYRGIPRTENQPNNVVLHRTVDTYGRITSQTDGRQHTTDYEYDNLDRLISITPPLGATSTIVWPKQTQRLLTRGDFLDTVTYNNQGYLSARRLSGEESIVTNKRYDVTGRLLFESYPNSEQGISYSYDALDRIVQTQEPDGKTQRFVYKSYDRIDMTDGKNQTVEYYYRAFSVDDERELMAVVEPEGTTTVITRDLLGNITHLNQNDVVRTYTYNSRYFLVEENNPETGATQYYYDGVGNLVRKQVNGAGNINYTYDSINRLTSTTTRQ